MQYLKKDVGDKVDFLHADKHESALQGDTITTPGHDQASILSVLKVTSLQYLYIYIFTYFEVRDRVHFCMQISIKVSTS